MIIPPAPFVAPVPVVVTPPPAVAAPAVQQPTIVYADGNTTPPVVNVGPAAPRRPFAEDPGVQILTRGPIHEAFAETVSFNPEAGILIQRMPPSPIEESAPDQRTDGDNVDWIPGYWAWDDDRNDFLWVSGTWRALPPGRQWMPGYWARTRGGSQWISGYWADARAMEVEYLPTPPASMEAGPNLTQPSPNHVWVSGCWIRHNGRYVWRPGYWAVAQIDWVWMPAHYVWSPNGYIFIEGYWDYAIQRRGVVYAPVYIEPTVYARPNYRYSPTIVITTTVFTEHLFVRPRYGHYYFGDYYDVSYSNAGYYSSHKYNNERVGSDPISTHDRWKHRDDRQWEARKESTFREHRDHRETRPPRTFAVQQQRESVAVSASAPPSDKSSIIGALLEQVIKSSAGPMRVQAVNSDEKQKTTQRVQDMRKFQDERRTAETKTSEPTDNRDGREGRDGQNRAPAQPIKVKQTKSPVVAKRAEELGKGRAPPQALEAPAPDLKVEAPPARIQPIAKPDPAPKPAPVAAPIAAPTPRAPQPVPVPRTEPKTEPKHEPRVEPTAPKIEPKPTDAMSPRGTPRQEPASVAPKPSPAVTPPAAVSPEPKAAVPPPAAPKPVSKPEPATPPAPVPVKPAEQPPVKAEPKVEPKPAPVAPKSDAKVEPKPTPETTPPTTAPAANPRNPVPHVEPKPPLRKGKPGRESPTTAPTTAPDDVEAPKTKGDGKGNQPEKSDRGSRGRN